jgi:hypothetical protein
MNREETQKIIVILVKCYTERLMPKIDSDMINVWHTMLQDLEYKEVSAAVQALIAEKTDYPPTIGEIRGKIAEAKTMRMPAADAWLLIRKAIRMFGYYRESEAEAWLGSEIWNAKKNTWEYFCTMNPENATTCFAQFRAAYEAEAKYKLIQSQIPEGAKRQLEALRPIVTAPCLLEDQKREHIRNLDATYNREEEE